ncbi:MAG: polyribonucleotide nucleotidyltransferase [Candidatus Omnitrophica bacterium]|nr:polyribonucleotide nucleotidyltransferase [Candidatus Omnitrophota bacterium]
MSDKNKIVAKLGDKELIIETGKMAKQADAAITVQLGGTVVLVTAVPSKKPREGMDFFPLFVEYQEKTYAAGKIPGGFFKREGRPSEKEILTSRLIDRPIRPLFPDGMRNEVQVMALVLSYDGENDSDVLAMIGASCALTISSIPFDGPVGSVRVGKVADRFILNPTFQELELSELDLIMAVTKNGIVMLESGSKEISEEEITKAIDFGYEYAVQILDIQKKLASSHGKEKFTPVIKGVDKDLYDKVKKASIDQLKKNVAAPLKEQREEALELLTKELIEKFVSEEASIADSDVKRALHKVEKEVIRGYIVESEKRTDGRKRTEIREITCEAGLLPRTHGSGLFTRGQTQSLSTTTLGTSVDERMIDALEGKTYKSFMLHYNFPPFSVGEVKPVRGPGRREIGHGALAERALAAVLPPKEKFPYTIRMVSEILESNGSSSMATVCGGTLALMDAGVPISAPVSGIAMGLVKEGTKEIILTDIAGAEDHFGDMDFKVAGTKAGITAVQMDLKIDGISKDLVKKVLSQAKDARMVILDKIIACIPEPRAELSAYAPRITLLKIPLDKIGEVIGPGGKMIRKIISETGATIDIEDDGTVMIASVGKEGSDKAIAMVNGMIKEAEVGKIYKGRVTKVMNFGAFVEILPGKEGLVHVSELAADFVKNVDDVVKVGDELEVKLVEIDSQGRRNLSRRAVLLPDAPPRAPKRDFGGDKGRGGGRPSRGPRR